MFKGHVPYLPIIAAIITGFITGWALVPILIVAALTEVIGILYVVAVCAASTPEFIFPYSLGYWITAQYAIDDGVNIYDMLVICALRLIAYYALFLSWPIVAAFFLIVSLVY